jgi:hypothetical protein
MCKASPSVPAEKSRYTWICKKEIRMTEGTIHSFVNRPREKEGTFDHEGILGHKQLLKKEKKPSGFIQGSMETHTRSGVFECKDKEKISAESTSPSLKTNSPSSSLRPDMGRCRKYTNSGCNISNCHPSSSFEGSSNT